MHSTVRAARVAGAIYLAMVLIAPFSMIYVPEKLIVHGNAVTTARNILSHETWFRVSIVGELIGHVIFIGLGLALYRLLNEVNKGWAGTMVALVLVSAAIGFFNTLNQLAALVLFRGDDFLSVFDKGQLDALAYFFLRLNSQGNFMNEIFWGLWLLPFGLLVFRSGFLPRLLGLWLMISCFFWLALSAIALLLPTYYEAAFRYSQPALFSELAIMLYLLIKGAKVVPARTLHNSGRSHETVASEPG